MTTCGYKSRKMRLSGKHLVQHPENSFLILHLSMAWNKKPGCVYIMTTASNTALYTGVTANLRARVWQHQHPVSQTAFTARYHCTRLVYYQWFEEIGQAIAEEKRIKAGNRAAKVALVESKNPFWKDLSAEAEEM